MRVNVDHFTGEEQIGDDPAAHCTGFNFFHTDAATGNHCLPDRAGSFYGERQRFEFSQQGVPLSDCDLAAWQNRRDPAQAGQNLREAGGQQARQDTFQLLFSGFREVPAYSRIQLLPG